MPDRELKRDSRETWATCVQKTFRLSASGVRSEINMTPEGDTEKYSGHLIAGASDWTRLRQLDAALLHEVIKPPVVETWWEFVRKYVA